MKIVWFSLLFLPWLLKLTKTSYPKVQSFVVLKVVNNFLIKIKIESATLRGTCEVQFVNRA